MLVSFQLKCILAFQWVSISANVKQFHKLCTLYLGIFLSRKTIIFWKDYGIFCLCLPWGSLIEQNDIKNSVRRLLKSFSTFYMKFFVIISRLLKKEYGIPHSFLCNISKELYQDGNRLRGGAVAFKRFFLVAIRSFVMNVVCFLLLGCFFFSLSFSFRSWDEGAKCSLSEVHRQKRWLFMPQVMVWDIHEVKNSLNSFHLVTLWEVYLWTPSHTLAQAIWRPTLKQQACTWTHKSPR